MKPALLILVFIISSKAVLAQENNDVENVVRALEQVERQATLNKDTLTLRKLWSENLTVNSPFNRVIRGGRNTFDRPVITQLNYESFERNIEDVLVRDNLVVTMGNEVVVEKGKNGAKGRTINRRYTNIWQKENGQWKMVGRHANLLCASQ